MKKGFLPYFFIFLITAIGVVNFAAPFFNDKYETDPWITYVLLVMGLSIAGYKVVDLAVLMRRNGTNGSPPPPTADKVDKEIG